MDKELEAGSSDAVARQVRELLARRRLSRQWLADQARVSLSTLEKALAGRRPFTLATLIRLEEALGTSLRPGDPRPSETVQSLAPESMGAYARPAVEWLEGVYLTLRPSFSDSGAVFAYLTSIAWCEAEGHLTFSESSRVDSEYEQRGFISFPYLSGAIYLVTNSGGQYRLAILNRPAGSGALSGVLVTLAALRGAQLVPAAVPMTLIPEGRWDEPQPELGVVRSGDRCFEAYRDCVDRVAERGYALFPS